MADYTNQETESIGMEYDGEPAGNPTQEEGNAKAAGMAEEPSIPPRHTRDNDEVEPKRERTGSLVTDDLPLDILDSLPIMLETLAELLNKLLDAITNMMSSYYDFRADAIELRLDTIREIKGDIKNLAGTITSALKNRTNPEVEEAEQGIEPVTTVEEAQEIAEPAETEEEVEAEQSEVETVSQTAGDSAVEPVEGHEAAEHGNVEAWLADNEEELRNRGWIRKDEITVDDIPPAVVAVLLSGIAASAAGAAIDRHDPRMDCSLAAAKAAKARLEMAAPDIAAIKL